MGDWTFFSNHGHVLVCLANNREARLRDVALEVGITERAVQKIVRDFQDAGIVSVTKQGRCNRYRINRRKALRHNLVSHCTVGKLLTLLARSPHAAQRMAAIPAQAEPAMPEPAQPEPAQPEPEQHKPEAAAATHSDDKAPSPREKAPEDATESPSGDVPIDTRQQGSLF
jgi:hypothetical protein